MKGLKTTKRLVAAVLSLVMVLGMLPVIPLTIHADEGQDYVSLPITIRDFVADGMLFECNELSDTGDYVVTTSTNVAPDYDFYAKGFNNYISSGSAGYTITESSGITKFTANWQSTGLYVTTNAVDNYTIKNLRYVAIRYRIDSVISSRTPTFSVQADDYSTVKTINLTAGSWQTAVLDCSASTLGLWRLKITPYLKEGGTLQIDYMAGFATEADAQAYIDNGGKVVVTDSTTYHHGSNNGFGMLATTDASHINNLFEDMTTDGLVVNKDGIPGTTYYRNGKWGSAYKEPYSITLNSGIQQTLYGGVIRTDLVGPQLVDGKPVYTEAAVTYIANYMSQLLPEKWQNDDGSYNLWHIMGQKLEALGGQDLASHLRTQIAANNNAMGTYAEAQQAFGTEALDEYTDIDTYFEAAYFLLHSTFADSVGYGKTISAYKELRLIEQTADDGSTYYVFNSGYNDAAYEPANGVIYNTQTTNSDYHQGLTSNETALRGNPWYKNRFDPLNPSLFSGVAYEGYPISGDIYRDVAGMTNDDAEEADYYTKTNYHMTLEGHAQFIYHYDDNLYFTFTGDDDVYLYINGVRVLDLGGGHAISKVKISLNDPTIIEKCGLQEGEAYDFDFFYLERHGSAANFSIETNIKIVDPSMVTTKKAYQDGVAVGYNGYINVNKPVTYEFGLTNKGEAHINNITFTDKDVVDNDIGVVLSPDTISLNGETSLADLRITHYNADGSVKALYTGLSEDEIKAILVAGLAVGEKIEVYGINYTIPANKWVNDSFVNRVETSAIAHYENASTKTLNGKADWMVQKYDIVFDSLHAYDWGKLKDGALATGTSKGVSWTLAELLKVIETATDAYGNPLVSETYDDLVIDVNNHANAAAYANYSNKVLILTSHGANYSLGTIDLSKYSAVTITYGSHHVANLGDEGCEVFLTENGAVQNSDASDKTDAKMIASGALSNSTAAWASGNREVSIPLNSTYNGEVFITNSILNGNGIAISKIEFVGKTANAITLNNATVEICSASGSAEGGFNKNAVVNADGGIDYKAVTTGADTFYYNIVNGDSEKYGPIAVAVYTYGVSDNVYVLDYNLPVELNGAETGFLVNDVLDLGGSNPFGTTYNRSNYAVKDNSEDLCGSFTVSDESVKYTMNKFMNGVDTLEIEVTVLENGKTTVNKTTGVTMTQTVTVVPANVMYYEDDFTGDGAITYVNTGSDVSGNIWAVYTGENVGTEQSADQDMNYGFDPNYDRVQSSNLLFNADYCTNSSLAADVLADIDPAINEKYGKIEGYLGGNASNDTLHVLKVNNAKSANVMSFGFTGTGFEIVSRTTTYAYAVLTVKIERLNNEGKWETYKVIPVITECIGGDLAQIPVIARKDMPYGQYQVTVSTSNMNGFDRAFYVDGIRIYQPLTDAQEALYYKADEANVTFTEIKTSIKNENIIYGTISPSMAESEIPTEITRWQYGTTMIEDQSGSFVLSQTDAYNTYMSYGPNNEIYLNTSDGGSLAYIAFYVTEDASYTGERSIQVGAHLKKTTDNEVEDDPLLSVSLVYGGSSFNFGSSDYTYSVVSGTEQYYSINTDCLKFKNDPNNEGAPMRALVIIGTDDPNQNTLALTNLKLNGYSIVGEGTIADEVEAAQDESDINVSTAAAQTYALYKKYTAEN